MKTLAIAGTFDTKGAEFAHVAALAQRLGLATLMIDTGTFESDLVQADVTHRDVAEAAGHDIDALIRAKNRAGATAALTDGMAVIVPQLFEQGRFDAIMSLGGSGGTAIVTAGMRALPIGVPKLMVSTMAAGNVEQYVGTSDIMMMPSIVDVAGVNKISRVVFGNAVRAMAGMLGADTSKLDEQDDAPASERPLIAASMFGVTTPCVTAAKEYLEDRGFEVVVFHATGTGGRTMESLITDGYFAGVLDLTTTEWCDEVVGGVLAAGPSRCSAAGLAGVPQVVSVGATDMVNFGPPDTVPERFEGRTMYQHNPSVTLMRTTPDEVRQVGERIAENLNQTTGPTTVLLPMGGVSMLDAEGQPFRDESTDHELFQTLHDTLDAGRITIEELPQNINDQAFAHAAAQRLVDLIDQANQTDHARS